MCICSRCVSARLHWQPKTKNLQPSTRTHKIKCANTFWIRGAEWIARVIYSTTHFERFALPMWTRKYKSYRKCLCTAILTKPYTQREYAPRTLPDPAASIHHNSVVGALYMPWRAQKIEGSYGRKYRRECFNNYGRNQKMPYDHGVCPECKTRVERGAAGNAFSCRPRKKLTSMTNRVYIYVQSVCGRLLHNASSVKWKVHTQDIDMDMRELHIILVDCRTTITTPRPSIVVALLCE